MDGQKRVGRVKMTVQSSATLFVVACLVIPASGSAQTVVLPAPPLQTPSPFRLFKDVPPEPTREWFGSIKSPNWWEPPASGSDIPRWAIGHTVRVKVPGGVGLSAGLFGRRGDPLPLYLSEVFVQPAQTSVAGPGSYRLQWDAKLGLSAPVIARPRLKLDAAGELFLPLTRAAATPEPSSTFLSGGTRLFKLVTKF